MVVGSVKHLIGETLILGPIEDGIDNFKTVTSKANYCKYCY
jgi:hypothetical protein